MVKYRGKNQVMWDAWFLPVGDEVPVSHLQMPVQDPEHPAEITWNVGHIRTRDLLHWEACPDILPPLGDANEQDYGCKFTGCAYTAPDGEHLVYYTMRDTRKGNQRIGVAQSRDLVTFEPDAGNPVLEPDPALCVSYENFDRYDWDIVDCRDLVVVRDPDSGLYYGYVAVAADVGREHPVGAVIVAESRDLLHWEKQSIAYVPQQNGVIEVPDVFEMDGKWYLTMLSGANYAGRSICRDDYVVNCTIYAVADHPRGPFLEAADNPFIGGIVNSGFTCRTVCFGGKRYLYYVDRAAGGETLSLPKEVRACGGRCGPICTHPGKTAGTGPIGGGNARAVPGEKQLCLAYLWRTVCVQWGRVYGADGGMGLPERFPAGDGAQLGAAGRGCGGSGGSWVCGTGTGRSGRRDPDAGVFH